jgi:hypothetical protein
MESNTRRSEKSTSLMDLSFFQNNFGGYLLAGAVVLVEYAALTAFAPRLATPILMVTALGIVLFWFGSKRNK